jgi:hypothetical protein
MAELPGWDRARLASADPADVAAARWIVFGRAVRPLLERNVEAELDDLAFADMSPNAREQASRQRRRDARTGLRKVKTQQDGLRALLELDAPDDEPAEVSD